MAPGRVNRGFVSSSNSSGSQPISLEVEKVNKKREKGLNFYEGLLNLGFLIDGRIMRRNLWGRRASRWF